MKTAALSPLYVPPDQRDKIKMQEPHRVLFFTLICIVNSYKICLKRNKWSLPYKKHLRETQETDLVLVVCCCFSLPSPPQPPPQTLFSDHLVHRRGRGRDKKEGLCKAAKPPNGFLSRSYAGLAIPPFFNRRFLFGHNHNWTGEKKEKAWSGGQSILSRPGWFLSFSWAMISEGDLYFVEIANNGLINFPPSPPPLAQRLNEM